MTRNEKRKKYIKIKEAYEAGMSKSEIVNKYNISLFTVRTALNTEEKDLIMEKEVSYELPEKRKMSIYVKPDLKIGQVILVKYPGDKIEEHGEKKKCKVVSLHKWFVRVQDKYGIITGFSYWDIWKYGKY